MFIFEGVWLYITNNVEYKAMGKVILASAPIATAGSSMAASINLSNVASKGYIKAGYHVIKQD